MGVPCVKVLDVQTHLLQQPWGTGSTKYVLASPVLEIAVDMKPCHQAEPLGSCWAMDCHTSGLSRKKWGGRRHRHCLHKPPSLKSRLAICCCRAAAHLDELVAVTARLETPEFGRSPACLDLPAACAVCAHVPPAP
eukprot:scaffold4407_cov123-Isochrysis_galbana.AAC.9